MTRITLILIFAAFLTACSDQSDGGGAPQQEDREAPPGDGSGSATTADAARVAALLEEAGELAERYEYAAARRRYREVLEIVPGHPAAVVGAELKDVTRENAVIAQQRVLHGVNLAYIKDFLNARDAFIEAAELDPNNEDAQFQLANVCINVRRYHEAMRRYDELLRRSPDEPKYRLNGAVAAHLAGDYDRCLEFLRDLEGFEDEAENDPKLAALIPDVWFLRGVAANETHRIPEAIDALNRAARLADGRADIHRYLGTVFLAEARYDLAIRELKRVVEITPQSIEALHNLGVAHEKKGEEAEAIEWYKAALARDNTQFATAVRIARCYEALGGRDNEMKGLSYLDVALQVNPLSHEALHTMQGLYRKLGNTELSEHYQQRYKRVREYARAQEERLRALSKRIRKDENDEAAHLEGIEILTSQFHWEDAMLNVRKLLNIKPDSVGALWHMARLLNVQRDVHGTLYESLKLIDAAPRDSRGYTMTAIALYTLERPADALPHARRAFSLNSADFGAIQILVEVLRKLGGEYAREAEQLMPLYNRLAAQEEQKLREMQAAEDARNRELLGDDQ